MNLNSQLVIFKRIYGLFRNILPVLNQRNKDY